MEEKGNERYKRGKIYKLWSPQGDEIYIGSTINDLAKRLSQHRYEHNSSQYLFKNYNDIRIELLEEYPCNNKMELVKKEGEYIRNNNCLNKLIAGRTKKEWKEDNKEHIAQQNKIYTEINKEYISQQKKEYYENKKEQIDKQHKEYYEKNKTEKLLLQQIRNYFKNKNVDLDKMKSSILDNLTTKIKDSTDIKESSKVAYLSRINTLSRAENFPFKNQTQLLDLIEELNPNDNLNSELNIITQLLIFTEIYDKFKKLFSDEMIKDLKIEQDMLSSAKKEKVNEKRDNDVSWKELQDLKPKVEDLKRDERLLYMLYINPGLSFVPRNDFSSMKIVENKDDVKDDKQNYYIKDSNKFILNEYKTSKKYGRIEFDAPKETIPLIEKNTSYVFEDADGSPMKENTIQHKITRMFEKLTDTKVTINTIRRAFANYIADLPEKERTKIAHKMGHSGHTNKKMYKYEDKEGEKE